MAKNNSRTGKATGIGPGKSRLPALRSPSSGDYEVGYGKPPKHSRFKAGQSGNPRGRPKGATNHKPEVNQEWLQEIVLEEAYRTITVRDGERQVDVPMAQAVVRTLAVNAAKGNNRAQKLFTEMLSQTERFRRERQEEFLQIAIQYKTGWEQELAYRARHGIVDTEPLPHPDDVLINMNTGEVRYVGPLTKEEKDRWERLMLAKQTLREDIAEMDAYVSETRMGKTTRDTFEGFLEQNRASMEKIRTVLPDDLERKYRARGWGKV
jgi:hypothetical protein